MSIYQTEKWIVGIFRICKKYTCCLMTVYDGPSRCKNYVGGPGEATDLVITSRRNHEGYRRQNDYDAQ